MLKRTNKEGRGKEANLKWTNKININDTWSKVGTSNSG